MIDCPPQYRATEGGTGEHRRGRSRAAAVLELGDRTRASIRAVITALRTARERITAVTVGSTHPLVRRTLGQHSQALDRAEHALADLDAAQRAVADYLSTMLGRPAAPGSASPPAESGPATDAMPANPAGFDPEPYLAQMPRFTPDASARPKTHGRWTDHTGTTHHLLSGRHDGYHTKVDQHAVALGLIPAGTGLLRSGDVELKFAMRMRERWQHTGTPPRETIVINKPDGPCEGRLGCDALLPRFLPPGGQLTVHWPGGAKTYRGEGD